MIRFVRKNKINLGLILLYMAITAIAFVVDFKEGKEIFRVQFMVFLKEMIVFLPLIFILIGLGDVWISREKVEKHIGNESGVKGIVYVIFLSMAQVGPLYGAFPVAYLLWKKGASVRNIFIYLGAFCTIKIPMLTFEIGFLGLKFSLIRTLISLPIIILIAFLMDKFFGSSKFEIKNG